jgi:hypothetical protein
MKAIVLNLLAFNAGWLCCVLAGAHHLPWLGTLIAVLIVTRHLGMAGDVRKELSLILIAGGLGAIWDSALVYVGILEYPSGTLIEGTAPHWIIAMWLLFATTLNVTLRWLKHRPVLAALLGAVSGPAAYFAGHQLGGVQIPNLALAMCVLAFGWALFMPLLMALSNRFDGMKVQSSHPTLTECTARA